MHNKDVGIASNNVNYVKLKKIITKPKHRRKCQTISSHLVVAKFNLLFDLVSDCSLVIIDFTKKLCNQKTEFRLKNSIFFKQIHEEHVYFILI